MILNYPWLWLFEIVTHSFHYLTRRRESVYMRMNCKKNCEVREKTNKMQQLDVYYQHFLYMFRAPLCTSSGEQDVCYCMWCAALVLLDVVGSGCGALCFRVRALWRLPKACKKNVRLKNIVTNFIRLNMQSFRRNSHLLTVGSLS